MNKNKIIAMQLFANGDNNNLAVRRYEKEFKELLQAVFAVESHFSDFFGGGIEALDGITNRDVAFSVKTSDIPVVVGQYNKGANVAFGTGTSNTNRFGNRTEIIYTDTDVEYTWGWSIHEGIDRHTVNQDFETAIADRLELHANAKTNQFDSHHAAFIAGAAAKTETLAGYTEAAILALFNKLSKYYNNLGVKLPKVAKVSQDLYNAIVDHSLASTGKGSRVNIDENEIIKWKGFEIEAIPDDLFIEDESGKKLDVAYVYVRGIGKAFTGIETTRTIESEDFDGVALQGAGKAGEYVLPDNKAAIVKVQISTAS